MNRLLLKAAPYLIAVAVGGGWLLSHDARQRELGALRERLRTADSLLVGAEARTSRLDSVVRVDTVHLRRIETRTVRLIDTLLHSDTVTLTQRESVLVFVADSLVTACRSAVDSCTALNGNLLDRLRLTESQRDAYRRLQPSWGQRTRRDLTVAAVSALLTYLIARH